MVSGIALVKKAVLFLGLGLTATADTVFTPIASEMEAALDGTAASSENGCGDQLGACSENSVCSSCLGTEFGDDNSGDDNAVFSCGAINTWVCDTYGSNSTCNDNAEYEAYVDCLFEAIVPECEIDLCGSAMGLTRYNGVAVLISAAVAGLLAVALGTL